MVTRQNILAKIIAAVFAHSFFVSLIGSEKPFYKDTTLANYNVISPHNHLQNFTDTILVSPDEQNKLFVCYAGYQVIGGWYCYGIPNFIKKTNILVEMDPCSDKMECAFEQLPEIDNKIPVTDILRSKDLYLVAHQKSIYLYNKIQTFMQHALKQKKHYDYPLADNDHIKKVFCNNNSIIAVSSLGAIYHNDRTTSDNPTLISMTFAQQPEQIHSFAYNVKNNMIFIGLTGSVRIVALNETTGASTYTINFAPNLSINTIDTSNSHILLSDVIENKHIKFDLTRENGHLKKVTCCRERYDWDYQLRQYIIPDEQKDPAWDQRETEIVRPFDSRQDVPEYCEQLPNHKTFEDEFDEAIHLPTSCLNNPTAIVVSFENLMKQIETQNFIRLGDVCPLSFTYEATTKWPELPKDTEMSEDQSSTICKHEMMAPCPHCRAPIKTITHLLLTDNSLVSVECNWDVLFYTNTNSHKFFGNYLIRNYTINAKPLNQTNRESKNLDICKPFYLIDGHYRDGGDTCAEQTFMLLCPTIDKKSFIKMDIGQLKHGTGAMIPGIFINQKLVDVAFYTEKPHNKYINPLKLSFKRWWPSRPYWMNYSFLANRPDISCAIIMASSSWLLFTTTMALSYYLKK